MVLWSVPSSLAPEPLLLLPLLSQLLPLPAAVPVRRLCRSDPAATAPDEKLDALACSLRTQPSGLGGWSVAAL